MSGCDYCDSKRQQATINCPNCGAPYPRQKMQQDARERVAAQLWMTYEGNYANRPPLFHRAAANALRFLSDPKL